MVIASKKENSNSLQRCLRNRLRLKFYIKHATLKVTRSVNHMIFKVQIVSPLYNSILKFFKINAKCIPNHQYFLCGVNTGCNQNKK